MLIVSKTARSFIAPGALAIFAVAWFGLLAWSALLTRHPIVLSDEAAYLLPSMYGYTPENYSRWDIIAQIPDVLFFRLYGVFRDLRIYFVAKILNAAFIAGAAIPAYLLARAWLDPRRSAVFAALVITTPICTFTRYFMPESLYCFGFWWVVFATLTAFRSFRPAVILLIAALLALLSLVKPHAFALVLAVAMFCMLRPGSMANGSFAALIVLACWYGIRVAAMYLLSGAWDLSLTGPAYAGMLSPDQFDPGTLLFNLAGHLAALTLLVGFPVAVSCVVLVRQRRTHYGPTEDLILLALCMLCMLVAMTVYFSYSVHFQGGVERITRLHGRYYAFALPLFMLAFIVVTRQNESFPIGRFHLALFVLATLLAWFVVIRYYETNVVDYPDLRVIGRWPKGSMAAAMKAVAAGIVVFALCLLTVIWMRRRGVRWQRMVPVIWWSTVSVSTSVLVLLAPLFGEFSSSDLDKAMMQDPLAVALRHRSDGMVIGTSDVPADTYRVMFYLASMARGRLVERGAVVHGDTLSQDAHWLILLPGVRYEGTGERILRDSFTYIRLR